MVLRRIIYLLVTTLALLLPGCARSAANKLANVQSRIASATSTTVYKGIPHPLFDRRGHANARAGETRPVPGGLAFPSPLSSSAAEQVRLAEAIRSIRTFKQYQGPYKDGGFWPAYAIRWETPNGPVDVSLFGSVFRFEWGNNSLHIICDDEATNSAIEEMLHAIEDTESKRLINSVYGVPTKPQL